MGVWLIQISIAAAARNNLLSCDIQSAAHTRSCTRVAIFSPFCCTRAECENKNNDTTAPIKTERRSALKGKSAEYFYIPYTR
jgi:hypothetical protein